MINQFLKGPSGGNIDLSWRGASFEASQFNKQPFAEVLIASTAAKAMEMDGWIQEILGT